jgi:hypothetical protein
MTIHLANPYVSSHQRFLLTGVQVGLEPSDNADPSTNASQQNQNNDARPDKPTDKQLVVPPPTKYFQRSTSMSGQVTWDGGLATMTDIAGRTSSLHEWPMFDDQQFSNKRNSNIGVNVNQAGRDNAGMAAKMATSGSIFGGAMPDWPLDEFFGFGEFNGGFGFPEHGSSKVCILLGLHVSIFTYELSVYFVKYDPMFPYLSLLFSFFLKKHILCRIILVILGFCQIWV